MTFPRSLFAGLVLSATLSACVAPGVGNEDVAETMSNLSATSWTGMYPVDTIGHPPHMASLNGTTYYVFTGDGGALPGVSNDLYWRKRTGNTWSDPQAIPGQQTMDRVNLAAFNGYIYMVHDGDSDGAAVWFSRFDPATEQWSTNIKLPFTTFGGPPALAAFNNQLYLVGTRQAVVYRQGVAVTTYPMWFATMTTAEVFSTAQAMGQFSASRPSAAAFAGKLYVAHRNQATAEIVVSSLTPGATWSAPAYILAGPAGAMIRGDDVQIAATNGFLHLVHRTFDSNLTYWTYFDQCNWVPEVTIDAFSAGYALSMNTSPEGLALARVVDTGLWPYTDNHWYESRFIAPPPPITVPRCLLVIGG